MIQRIFRLADAPGVGVTCDRAGLFVGRTALLECDAAGTWRPRQLADINSDLTCEYGVPIHFAAKQAGLAVVARALQVDNIELAQIATLNLQLPDPPLLAKAKRSEKGVVDLVGMLQMSGMLAKAWDADKHPRWPAATPGSIGGQFAPSSDSEGEAQAAARVVGTNGPVLNPAPNAPFDSANKQLADAINALRSGDGARQISLRPTRLDIVRSGSRISVAVGRFARLTGQWADAPAGEPGIDILGLQVRTSLPALSVVVFPDAPGGSTSLDAQIRVVQWPSHGPNGHPVTRSFIMVRYSHTLSLRLGGIEVRRFSKDRFYGFVR
jgi:hypothetical protein